MPNSAAVLLERLDLLARQVVADLRGGRGAVGRHVVVGGGQRAVGAAHGAAGQPEALERLRGRDLVDEVQVDVEQARRDLVGVPDLVEQRLRPSAPPSPADTTARKAASAGLGSRSGAARSASKVTAVALGQVVRGAVTASRRPPSTRPRRSRGCRARAWAGRPGRRWRRPGASACRDTSARCPGSGGVSTS